MSSSSKPAKARMREARAISATASAVPPGSKSAYQRLLQTGTDHITLSAPRQAALVVERASNGLAAAAPAAAAAAAPAVRAFALNVDGAWWALDGLGGEGTRRPSWRRSYQADVRQRHAMFCAPGVYCLIVVITRSVVLHRRHGVAPPQLHSSAAAAAAAAAAQRYPPRQKGSGPSVGGFTRIGLKPQRPLPARRLRAARRHGVSRALAASAAHAAAQHLQVGQAEQRRRDGAAQRVEAETAASGAAARREARTCGERRARGRTETVGWSGCSATPGWCRSARCY